MVTPELLNGRYMKTAFFLTMATPLPLKTCPVDCLDVIIIVKSVFNITVIIAVIVGSYFLHKNNTASFFFQSYFFFLYIFFLNFL